MARIGSVLIWPFRWCYAPSRFPSIFCFLNRIRGRSLAREGEEGRLYLVRIEIDLGIR
jgi:hypothetical protein